MIVLKEFWLIINLIIIVLILIRSPNDQSVQDMIGSFDFFESNRSTKKNIDRLIAIFTGIYFLLAILINSKTLK